MNIAHVSTNATHAAINPVKGATKLAITPLREHIPIGRENAITSEELALMWGIPEREVRRVIAKMRITPTDDPCAILSEDGYPGFWRINIRLELESMVKRSIAKANNTYMSSADARRVLDYAQ